MARTIDDLRQMQALPLSLKVSLTKARIRQWVNEYGENGVYVSFSGGKDSTVLLHLVREMYPDIPAVFFDTGLEYPEIRDFVKTFDNVEALKPKMNFKKVIEKYGYPFISKPISKAVSEARHKAPTAIQRFEGDGKYAGGKYDYSKWHFLTDPDAPRFSSRCCDVMKKGPAHEYDRQTDRHPFTAEMAAESMLRTQNWLVNGCNMFGTKHPKSAPMSFWTEQDVLQYIRENNIEICSVYGEIVADEVKSENVEGQLQIDIDGNITETQCVLKTTGCDRTGCMFCGYGCHLNNDKRFVQMKQTHPKQYEWIMKPWEEGGLDYKRVIDWLNEHGNLHIKY